MVLKREPTPPGPISDLFDRLHELHLRAGEPGVRQIAAGIGRGVLSYTTVHNVFRGPRVPKWGNLELIVEQLGGDVELFRSLWQAARRAELAPPSLVSAEAVTDLPGPDRLFDFVLVTHRLPIRRDTESKAHALSDLAEARNAVWVSWAGSRDSRSPIMSRTGISFSTVQLTGHEAEAHDEGYCKSTLWPLYHNMIERPEFRHDWQETHRIVSRRFADAIARVAAHGAIVWLHDYQLQLVPRLLRQQRPDLRIGFFLHISFPSVEVFRQLPGRVDVLRGLLGADLVGFQQPASVDNFLRLVKQLLGVDTSANSVEVDGRQVVVDAFPMSIDVTPIEQMAERPQTRRRAGQIRAELGNPKTLLVGLDRLDYSKGIEERLRAYGDLIESGDLPPEQVAFLQVAGVTRARMMKYAHLRERVERLAGHLNGKYGNVGRPIVHYTNKVFDFDEMVALYLAADIMVVTPLSDGMNLVSKEYVASRVDNQGVLVLSEFAGAAAEFTDAILVNPNDSEDLKSAILRAIAMSAAEQRRRMEAMRWHLRTHDVDGWIAAFLTALDKAGQKPR